MKCFFGLSFAREYVVKEVSFWEGSFVVPKIEFLLPHEVDEKLQKELQEPEKKSAKKLGRLNSPKKKIR